jgi:hypothetical protein
MVRRARIGALLALALVACTSPPPPVDAGDDGAVDGGADGGPTCGAPAPFATGSVDGHATPLGAMPGEVRAGRLAAGNIPADPAGLATWVPGDYVLANDRVAFVISQPSRYEVYDPFGGRVRGIARLDRGAMVRPADFNLAMIGVGRFVVATESVTVLNDGTNGQPAIVRVTGPLQQIEALGPFLATLIRGELGGIPAALDYVLAPGSDAVDVRITLRRGPDAMIRIPFGTVAFFQSFRMPAWNEMGGFVAPSGDQRFVIFEDADATSFAWAGAPVTGMPNQFVTPILSMGGFDFYTSPGAYLTSCSEQTFALGRFVVGESDGLNGVQSVLARELGDTTRHVTGTLTSGDATAIAGARVHVTDATGMHHLTRATIDASGAFDLVVPMEAAEVWVWRDGVGLEGPFAIPASGPMSVPLASVASIHLDVSDATAGGALPARVALFPMGAMPPTAPDAFGEVVPGNGRSLLAFAPVSGHLDLHAAPGTYRLLVTHGWEMEPHDQTLTLAAGDERSISAALTRALDTPGVMCADYHIHTHRSVDSEDTGALKVSALAADGLDIAIRSEHEWVSDFQPVVESLGLQDRVVGLAGEELTTFTYGHFGVFPLVVDPARPSGSAVTWFNRLAPEVFGDVRARPEAPLLIINHPRANGIRQGYFRETGYDPTTGMVAHPENWDEQFDVVEVINSSSFEHNRGGTVVDWFSLLRSGRHVMMVGSSDSHHTRGDPVGYPRTCLFVGTDDVHAVTGDMVRDVTRAGTSFVMGGIYLDVTGPGGVRSGATATGVGMRTQLHVIVRAPSFVEVDTLEVIVDGTTTETMPLAPPVDPTNPVRFDGMIDVDVAATGSFVVIHASGTHAPDIAYGDTPFAVSNPIFLTR